MLSLVEILIPLGLIHVKDLFQQEVIQLKKLTMILELGDREES